VETWREGAQKLEKSAYQQVGWLKENKQGGGSTFLTLVSRHGMMPWDEPETSGISAIVDAI
jgi:hypothetical protein